MKKLLIILSLLIILGAVGVMALYLKSQKSQGHIDEVHIHAGFKVFVDDAQVDFSSLKYMKVSPCTTGDEAAPVNDQLEKAHLHDGNGDVVHVHRTGALWGDLFKNIKYDIDSSKKVTAYINDTQIENILTYPIKPYDSVTIFIGNNTDITTKLADMVTNDRIKHVESLSENCGTH